MCTICANARALSTVAGERVAQKKHPEGRGHDLCHLVYQSRKGGPPAPSSEEAGGYRTDRTVDRGAYKHTRRTPPRSRRLSPAPEPTSRDPEAMFRPRQSP
eukprot:4542127-Prymnesium_polylepis.2